MQDVMTVNDADADRVAWNGLAPVRGRTCRSDVESQPLGSLICKQHRLLCQPFLKNHRQSIYRDLSASVTRHDLKRPRSQMLLHRQTVMKADKTHHESR